MFYGIDVLEDQHDIHPRKICDTCYNYMKHSQRKASTNDGMMDFSGQFAFHKDKANTFSDFWKPHSDNCNVCHHFQEQMKAGPPQKQKHIGKGRIKLLYNTSDTNIFSSLFVDSVLNYKVSNCDITNLSLPQKSKYMCAICMEVLSIRSVSTGCHYFCDECLSGYFKSSKVNEISCPVCYAKIAYEHVCATDAHFRSFLQDMELSCIMCSTTNLFSTMKDHICQPEVSTDSLRNIQLKASNNTVSVQTTPRSTKTIPISLQRSTTSPLSTGEQQAHTAMTKRCLYDTLLCFSHRVS